MKRRAVGGTHRSPVAPGRQRRALRSVQIAFVALALVLFGLAAASYQRIDERRGDDLGPGRSGSIVQPVVMVILGLGALGAAAVLRAPGGGVRLPVPVRLEEMQRGPDDDAPANEHAPSDDARDAADRTAPG